MKFLASLAAMTLLGTLLQPAVAKDQAGHEISASTSPAPQPVTEVVRATGVIEALDHELAT